MQSKNRQIIKFIWAVNLCRLLWEIGVGCPGHFHHFGPIHCHAPSALQNPQRPNHRRRNWKLIFNRIKIKNSSFSFYLSNWMRSTSAVSFSSPPPPPSSLCPFAPFLVVWSSWWAAELDWAFGMAFFDSKGKSGVSTGFGWVNVNGNSADNSPPKAPAMSKRILTLYWTIMPKFSRTDCLKMDNI